MEAPFFLIAHFVDMISGGGQTGLSPTYGRGLALAGLFYFWAGAWFLYRFLSRYASSNTSFLTILLLLLGTNLFYYTFFQPAMSHVFSFCLFSVYLYLTDKIFHYDEKVTRHRYTDFIIYGLLCGLIVLVRPTNILVLLLPFYMLIKKKQGIINYTSENFFLIILSIFSAILVWLPQMMYWHYLSGQWFFWSYSDESFRYWKEPKLFRVLFDAWNGWILYSPLVVIPLMYLIRERHRNLHFERIYLYIFAIATYIFASWWAWWFGGAFGHRSFVEYLAFLAMPLALCIEEIKLEKFYYKVGFVVVASLLCYYSLGLTFVYSAPWDGDSWTYESLWIQIKRILFIG